MIEVIKEFKIIKFEKTEDCFKMLLRSEIDIFGWSDNLYIRALAIYETVGCWRMVVEGKLKELKYGGYLLVTDDLIYPLCDKTDINIAEKILGVTIDV